jgi:hypothetical protein
MKGNIMATNKDIAYENKKVEFLFSVFTETNEHIRATDEKNVLIAGSFIALISVVLAIFIEKMTQITWAYFAFSLFALTIGFCVLMLQFWYREWKEHYCEICKSIASKFELEDEALPFWLRSCEVKSFSTDKVLIIMTIVINISLISCSVYLLWNLLYWSIGLKLVIVTLLTSIYLLLAVFTKKKLINRQKPLVA